MPTGTFQVYRLRGLRKEVSEWGVGIGERDMRLPQPFSKKKNKQ
jgi:hypothetical protein